MFKVYQKLKVLRKELRSLNKKDYSDIAGKIINTRSLLSNLQNSLISNPFNEVLQDEERAVCIHLQKLLNWEESILRQKSRMLWIKLGDHNSKLFHRSLIQRHSKKKILSLKMQDGSVCTDKEKIKEEIVRHFENFFGSTSVNRTNIDYTLFNEGNVLDEVDRQMLDSEVSMDEIKEAIFSINDDKAPGPDGYTSAFFKKSWDIVGEEISQAILDFFASSRMLSQLNATTITLIPKVECPETISEYRPISYCNVLYKGISKIITKRISRVLNKLINPCQSAFVPDRSIVDNILVAHEIVRDYHRGKGKECAIKVDIQKAYDSLAWDFVEEVLIGFRFPNKIH